MTGRGGTRAAVQEVPVSEDSTVSSCLTKPPGLKVISKASVTSHAESNQTSAAPDEAGCSHSSQIPALSEIASSSKPMESATSNPGSKDSEGFVMAKRTQRLGQNVIPESRDAKSTTEKKREDKLQIDLRLLPIEKLNIEDNLEL